MFKRSAASNKQPPPTAANQPYAFSQPTTAQSSSAQQRQKEQETFYSPLPPPQATNPFGDQYRTSTRSPSPSRPLLEGEGMPPSQASSAAARYGPSAARGGMPNRGDSQSALLGDRQVSLPTGLCISFVSLRLRLPAWLHVPRLRDPLPQPLYPSRRAVHRTVLYFRPLLNLSPHMILPFSFFFTLQSSLPTSCHVTPVHLRPSPPAGETPRHYRPSTSHSAHTLTHRAPRVAMVQPPLPPQ